MKEPPGLSRVRQASRVDVSFTHFVNEAALATTNTHGDGVFEMLSCPYGCREWLRDELLVLLSNLPREPRKFPADF